MLMVLNMMFTFNFYRVNATPEYFFIQELNSHYTYIDNLIADS